jgi:hypothetical protein
MDRRLGDLRDGLEAVEKRKFPAPSGIEPPEPRSSSPEAITIQTELPPLLT